MTTSDSVVMENCASFDENAHTVWKGQMVTETAEHPTRVQLSGRTIMGG